METLKKARSPNFTTQECMLLSQIMGEEYLDFGISRHKVDKHKFNSKISSQTKRELWQEVENVFNANSTCCARTAIELKKKWDNLIAKHRAIYSDHKRLLALTGSGPVDTKYTVLTEAVIGKESVSVAGVGSVQLDTTFSQLQRRQSRANTFDEDAQEEDDSTEIKRLKKRKLQLQVEYLELQLKKIKRGIDEVSPTVLLKLNDSKICILNIISEYI